MRSRFVALVPLLASAACAVSGTPEATSTQEVSAAGSHRQIALGDAHACALDDRGTVTCWGSSTYGETGARPYTGTMAVPSSVDVLSGAKAIAAGGGSSCAIMNDGTVSCWGKIIRDPRLNAPYAGDTWSTRLPVKVAGVADAVEIVINQNVSSPRACARTSAGAVLCWGSNRGGGLVTGDFEIDTSVRTVISSGATALSRSGSSIFALVNGAVKGWGSNWDGALGIGAPDDEAIAHPPTDVRNAERDVVAISGACAIKTDDSVWCWGPTVGTNVATLMTRLPAGVRQFATTSVDPYLYTNRSSCVLTSAGEVWCWGANDKGQTGTGSAAESVDAPTKVNLPAPVTAIAAGEYSPGYCAIAGGSAYCWGENYLGRLGTPLPVKHLGGDDYDIQRFSNVPMRVTALEDAVLATSLESQLARTCGVGRDGVGRCWNQQILWRDSLPVKPEIHLGSNLAGVSMNRFDVFSAYCTVDTTNRLHCTAGYYDYGLTTDVPTEPVKSVAMSSIYACAVLERTGGVQCWGRYGNPNSQIARWVADPSLGLTSGIKALAGFGDHQCALTTSKDLVCFGSSYPDNEATDKPHVVMTEVEEIVPHTLCLERTTGEVLCPKDDGGYEAGWELQSSTWPTVRAELFGGRHVNDP